VHEWSVEEYRRENVAFLNDYFTHPKPNTTGFFRLFSGWVSGVSRVPEEEIKMRDTDRYQRILGLGEPWFVKNLDLQLAENRVDIWLKDDPEGPLL
jgi:hypothetical protein